MTNVEILPNGKFECQNLNLKYLVLACDFQINVVGGDRRVAALGKRWEKGRCMGGRNP